MLKRIPECRDLRRHLFVKGAFMNTPVWQEFVTFINWAYQADPIVVPDQEGVTNIGTIRFYDPLTMSIGRVTREHFPQLQTMSDTLQEFGEDIEGGISVISLTTAERSTGKHCDNKDVVFWQCIGKTEWTVWYKEEEFVYILEPGDVIYIPRLTMHQVVSIEPRASISMALQKAGDYIE